MLDADRLVVDERYRDSAAGSADMESAGVQCALEAFGPLLEPPRLTALTWHGGFTR